MLVKKVRSEIINIERELARMRKTAKSLQGGLGGAMLTLLGAQGYLEIAAQASRRLQITSPRLWKIQRLEPIWCFLLSTGE